MSITERQRVLRTLRYEDVDRRPLHLAAPWTHTVQRWRREGLPGDQDPHEHLGVRGTAVINLSPIYHDVYPPFEEKVIREDEQYVYHTDNYGCMRRDFKDHTSMPEWVEAPVKGPEDLRRVLDEHFRVDDMDGRFGPTWRERVRKATESDAAVLVNGGGYYWAIRSLAGVEQASYLFYDAPELVEEMFERQFTVVMEGLRRVAKVTTIDLIGFGEDIAFKNGPLISPEMYRRLILPRYRKAMDYAHELGCRLTWYDSDGDLRLLIPDMLSVGINSASPCEVAAGMAPVELRARFGRELRMFGGIDKRQIARGREAIDAEIARNLPIIREGGFVAGIDHSVPSDVSWDDYRYYIDAMRKAVRMS